MCLFAYTQEIFNKFCILKEILPTTGTFQIFGLILGLSIKNVGGGEHVFLKKTKKGNSHVFGLPI